MLATFSAHPAPPTNLSNFPHIFKGTNHPHYISNDLVTEEDFAVICSNQHQVFQPYISTAGIELPKPIEEFYFSLFFSFRCIYNHSLVTARVTTKLSNLRDWK